jgi:hypothetical protein
MNPYHDLEERVSSALTYVAEMPPGAVETAPPVHRMPTGAPSGHRPRRLVAARWTSVAAAIGASAALVGGALAFVALERSPSTSVVPAAFVHLRPPAHLPTGLAPRWRVAPIRLPAQRILTGVSCLSVVECVAVGARTPLNVAVAVVDRFEPGHSGQQPTGVPGKTLTSAKPSYLLGVSCLGPTQCVAVGASHGQPLAASLDGDTWSTELLPHTKSGSELRGVSCTGADFCMAVGAAVAFYSCRPRGAPNGVECSSPTGLLVERWDGSRWQTVLAPDPSSDSALLSVSCVSATDCVAVGGYPVTGQSSSTATSGVIVERWDGKVWQLQRAPSWPQATLYAVSCVTATYCEAVGTGPTGAALEERWDGTTWQVQADPPGVELGALLQSVSCVNVDYCEAVGQRQSRPRDGTARATVEVWDGSTWQLQPAPPAMTSDFESVNCLRVDDCIAVGFTNGFDPRPLVEQFN